MGPWSYGESLTSCSSFVLVLVLVLEVGRHRERGTRTRDENDDENDDEDGRTMKTGARRGERLYNIGFLRRHVTHQTVITR
jgi:hypothetical protein